MLFATVVVFFGICACCVHGIGDNCLLATTFTNSKAPHYLPQALDFDCDVLMNFVNYTNAQVELQDIRLNAENKTFSPHTIRFLQISFNVTFRYAKVAQIHFSGVDNQYSKRIKTDIIEYVWNHVHDTTFLSTCFQNDEPFNGSVALDVDDSALNLTKMPEINWIQRGYVTRVKGQTTCFCCWAFPSVGLVEFLHMKKTGTLLTFSEQRLLDCRKKHSRFHGCNSHNDGDVKSGLEPISSDGTCLETKVPWTGADQPCKVMPAADLYYKNARFNIVEIPKKKEIPMHLPNAPIAASVYVDPVVSPWDTFKGEGILKVNCRGKETNHAILIVGSGTYNGEEYVLIKNSWGTGWGDNGYGKIGVGRDDDSCLKQFISIS